jgi:phage regulator Rha-like protein
MKELIPQEIIEKKIFLIRGQKVMLSTHLVELYGVEVRALVQAVKRNIKKFPEDFMFQLTWVETNNLKSHVVILKDSHVQGSRSQFVTLKRGQNIKYKSYAFTEQGVAILSSVFRSERAIDVNIAIMRAFVKLREIVSTHKELAHKLSQIERKIEKHDTKIRAIF